MRFPMRHRIFFAVVGFVLCITACDFESTEDPAVDSIDLGELRLYRNTMPGCGSDLNPEAVALQAKGISALISYLEHNGRKNLYDYHLDNNARQELSRAATDLEKAVQLEPKLIPAYLALSDYYNKVELNYAKSVLTFTGYRKHCSGESYSFDTLWLGAYRQIAEYQHACNSAVIESSIRKAKKALEKNSNDEAAYEELVQAYDLRGDFPMAIDAAKKLSELDPHGTLGEWAKNALSRLEKTPEHICSKQSQMAAADRAQEIMRLFAGSAEPKAGGKPDRDKGPGSGSFPEK
jgi:tetratricopeptide (TPR) repeat protein